MEALLAVSLKQYFDWIGANLLTRGASASEKEKISRVRKRIGFLAADVDNAFRGFSILQSHLDSRSIPGGIDSLWKDEDFEIARSACAVQLDELNAIAAAAREAFEGFPASRRTSPAASETWCMFRQTEAELAALQWLDAYLAQAAAAGTVLRDLNAREAHPPRELSRYFLEPLEPLDQEAISGS